MNPGRNLSTASWLIRRVVSCPLDHRSVAEKKLHFVKTHYAASLAQLPRGNLFKAGETPVRNLSHAYPMEQKTYISFTEEINHKGNERRIYGISPVMQHVLGLLERASRLDISLLLMGASGTGKDLAAKYIHHASNSSRGVSTPFVLIGPEAPENDIFGHVHTNFAGSKSATRGMIEYACKGTLYIPFPHHLPKEIQWSLLSFLDGKATRRLGSVASNSVDARVIAALPEHPEIEIGSGSLDEGFYLRLNQNRIHLPLLKDRPGDICLLADFFLTIYNTKIRKALQYHDLAFSDSAYALFQDYGFVRGNVRELQHTIKSAVFAAPSDRQDLTKKDFPWLATPVPPCLEDAIAAVLKAAAQSQTRPNVVGLVEQELYTCLYTETQGNLSEMARILKTSRKSVRERLRKYGLRKLPAPKHAPEIS